MQLHEGFLKNECLEKSRKQLQQLSWKMSWKISKAHKKISVLAYCNSNQVTTNMTGIP